MLEPTDETLAAEVQSGDTEAFGLLVRRYEDKLTRYARKFLFAGDDAADVVQEVFIKAFTNIKSFDVRKRFSPWIYRIAHNSLINEIKKQRRLPLALNLDLLLPHPAARETADDAATRAETRKLLDDCLDKLDQKYREVLVLYYYEELDYREIADILKIPIATVGIRLLRGKQAMKKIIRAADHAL